MESYSGVPKDRVYRVAYEGGIEDILIKFYISGSLDSKRWIYCWSGSPLHHCQVCIQGLVYNIYPSSKGRWNCEQLWHPQDSELAIQVKLEVPSNKINWDRILAVTVDKKMVTLKTLLWGILRGTNKYKHIQKPCPDCVSTAKDILGTMGIFCSGELPWELYESLTNNYEHEEERFRRFL